LAIAASTALVASCTAAPRPAGTAASVTLAATLGDHAAPAGAKVLLLQEAVSAPSAPAPRLLCDAPALTYLVGRRRTEIPVAADLTHRRVACTTCPVSEDRRPDRTDILFDARTGLVTAVTCG
jgi:hypothetical protein